MLVCVNIHGNEEISFDLDDMQSMEEDPKFIENKMDQAGGLSQAIRLAIINSGYEVSYAGCGISGWDIGVALEESNALLFEEFIRKRFNKAIECEMITVSSWMPGETDDEDLL